MLETGRGPGTEWENVSMSTGNRKGYNGEGKSHRCWVSELSRGCSAPSTPRIASKSYSVFGLACSDNWTLVPDSCDSHLTPSLIHLNCSAFSRRKCMPVPCLTSLYGVSSFGIEYGRTKAGSKNKMWCFRDSTHVFLNFMWSTLKCLLKAHSQGNGYWGLGQQQKYIKMLFFFEMTITIL